LLDVLLWSTHPSPAGLQKLYEKYQSSGLEVLAFPCNQFGNQEPGTDAEIEVFATGHYHTTFPMFSKIDVNGPSTHPVYKYLKEQLHIQDPPGLEWNFQKILVNRAGKPVLLLQQDWDQGRVEHAVYNLLVSGSAQ
jgi:glutathione peroxidase